jgi:hypothetical protein
MKHEDFIDSMEWLDGVEHHEWMLERLYHLLITFDEEISDLTPEQEATFKQRLIDAKKHLMSSDFPSIIRFRKQENIPKSRFWWYLDKLEAK